MCALTMSYRRKLAISAADQSGPTLLDIGGEWRAQIFQSWDLPATIRAEWEQAAQAYGDRGIFLSPGWLQTWWDVFGKTGHLFIAVLHCGERLKGIFPCWVRNDGVLCGLANEVYFDFLLDDLDRETTVDRFMELLRQTGLAKAHLPSLSRLYGNGATLLKSLRNTHFPFWTWAFSFGAIVDVSCSTWDEVESSFQSKLRNNLKKGRRKAEKEGQLTFEEVRDRATVETMLDELFAVEGSGWKAKEGTAISQSDEKLEWYRRISLWAAEQGSLRIYLLRLNGQLIAFDLALESGSTIFALKTGYDENIATRFSAGNLMRNEVLKALWARPDIAHYDFLGETYPWKLEWTQVTGESIDIFVYPKNVRGWTGYILNYGWKHPVKKARRLLLSE